ncbi:MAG: RNA pseudouridine synthase [Planctomycetales bacterium]
MNVIYCDNHLLVVRKPAGALVQPDRTGDPTLLDLAKEYVRERFDKPGEVYLTSVHRLDRPVSGVVVFARTSKAAARLHEQFRERDVRKVYWALVEGVTPRAGLLRDQLLRHGRTSHVTTGESGKEAKLAFRRVRKLGGRSALEIDLHTGRHHQIRVQLAAAGHPILGDSRYGSKQPFPERAIALHGHSVTLEHPTRRVPVTFRCDVDDWWPRAFAMEGEAVAWRAGPE